jgi:hypothetical protein
MRHFFYFLTLFIGINSWAQFGSISSQFCIGSTETDYPFEEAILNNGNRVILLASNSPSNTDKTENCRGDYDIWVLCLDPNDQIVWQKTIGGVLSDVASDLLITSDQYIYLSGSTFSPPSFEQTNLLYGNCDAWLIKMNSSGDILWNKNYGGSDFDYFTQLIELPSGNLMAFGISASGISGNKTSINYGYADIWSLKLDPNGIILNDKSIGGSYFEDKPLVVQTAPNRIKLVAESASEISGLKTEPSFGDNDIWVLDLDTNCNIIHQKTIGGTSHDTPNDVLWSNNSELLILANSWSNISGLKTENSYGYSDNWILKLDEQLNIIQQKTIGGDLYEFEGRFIEMPNGNLCVATSTESTSNQFQSEQEIGFSDIWIYLLDLNFNVIADQTIGTVQYETNVFIRPTTNPSEINLIMSSNGEDTNDKTCPSKGVFDLWGVKLNSTLQTNDIQPTTSLKVYPNPTSNFITIENNNVEQFLSINLLDYAGKQIKSIDPQNTSINLSDLAPGIYLLQITTPQGNYCEKIRLE